MHPLASAVTGVAAGAIAVLALPGALANAAGLLLAGAGLAASAIFYERRVLAQREQIFAAIGEVKVRLATNAIRLDSLAQRVE
ncbi:hypothetical protein AB4156_45385, partial [Cupriavidus sp. 2MCAB6]|uniref:hypothetical protein n=1 Tax=Cupriavidus sp. 2MCAB6 TaxID=3232981 RepID=UPI003F92C8DD